MDSNEYKICVEYIEDECLDLRCENVPTGGDDYDIIWSLYEHHMAEPHLRCVGQGESIIEAFRQAVHYREFRNA